jgi:hypothetical protein
MSKKHKISNIKIYNLCSSLKYTYDMRAYIAKWHKDATADLAHLYGTILQLGRRVV